MASPTDPFVNPEEGTSNLMNGGTPLLKPYIQTYSSVDKGHFHRIYFLFLPQTKIKYHPFMSYINRTLVNLFLSKYI